MDSDTLRGKDPSVLMQVDACARDFIAAYDEYGMKDLYTKDCLRRLKKVIKENPEL